LVERLESRPQLSKGCGRVHVFDYIVQAGREGAPGSVIRLAAPGEVVDRFAQTLAKILFGHRYPVDAEHSKRCRQLLIQREVVDRRDQLAVGQIAPGTEDDESGRQRSRGSVHECPWGDERSAPIPCLSSAGARVLAMEFP